MQLKEIEDLTPLLIGILAALTGGLCAAHWGAGMMTWLKAVGRQPHHRRHETTHGNSVGGPR